MIRRDGGVGESTLDRLGRSRTIRRSLGHVVCVCGVAHSGSDRMHERSSSCRMPGGLEHYHARTLAQYKAIPGLVEWPGSPLRIVVAEGKGAHRRERGEAHWKNGRLGSATTTSARPERIMCIPYPIASALDEQALTAAWTPARAPSSMPIHAAAPLHMSIGTANGDNRCHPPSLNASCASSVVPMPPTPLPTETPRRSSRTCGAPASCHACLAAISASCSNRSIRRCCREDSIDARSTVTGAAIRAGNSSAQLSFRLRTPD